MLGGTPTQSEIPVVSLDLPIGIPPGWFELAGEARVRVIDPPGLDVPQIEGLWKEVQILLQKSKDEPAREPFGVIVEEEIWEIHTPTGGGLHMILYYCNALDDRNRRRNRLSKNLRKENKKIRKMAGGSE